MQPRVYGTGEGSQRAFMVVRDDDWGNLREMGKHWGVVGGVLRQVKMWHH